MQILDRWTQYQELPLELHFPKLNLKGRDWSPDIISGTGKIYLRENGKHYFELTGKPDDYDYACRCFEEMHADKYNDNLAALRLKGTDEFGVKWSGGGVVPEPNPSSYPSIYYGAIDAMSAFDTGAHLPSESCVEMIVPLRMGGLAARVLSSIIMTEEDGYLKPEKTIIVFDSIIHFEMCSSPRALKIRATTCEDSVIHLSKTGYVNHSASFSASLFIRKWWRAISVATGVVTFE